MTPEMQAFEAHLKELMEVISTASTPGWMRIMTRLDELAAQAHEDMIGSGDKPDIVLAPLARRWIQREAMVRDVKEYLVSCQTEKDEILKSIDRSVPPDGEDRTT